MTHEKLKARVRARFEDWIGLSTATQRAAGLSWYREARTFCQEVAKTYRVPLVRVCGVLAALSPAVYWDLNKKQTEDLVRAHSEGEDLSDVVLSTYGRQADKARMILTMPDPSPERIADVLGRRAFKTRAFFANVFDVGSTDVTVDRHIVSAADMDSQWTTGAAWCYNLLADVIRELAAVHRVRPYELQAQIWTTFKEMTGAYSNAEGHTDEPEDDDIPF